MLRGAALWLLTALVLAWCLVGLNFHVAVVKAILPGKFHRVLQAHIDFLLMTALILGISATRVPLPPTARWAMVIGAFTNSSLFLLLGLFPRLDSPQPPAGLARLFLPYLFASLLITTYGFGRAAATILLRTFEPRLDDP